jgi:hypothetical protein
MNLEEWIHEFFRRPWTYGEKSYPGDPQYVPLGWHPFAVFHQLLSQGPVIGGCFALVSAALLAFCWHSRRHWHSSAFFSARLFLALVPFIACSVMAFLNHCIVLHMLLALSGMSHPVDPLGDLRRVAYSIQFGMLVSGLLLAFHSFVYVRWRWFSGPWKINPIAWVPRQRE